MWFVQCSGGVLAVLRRCSSASPACNTNRFSSNRMALVGRGESPREACQYQLGTSINHSRTQFETYQDPIPRKKEKKEKGGNKILNKISIVIQYILICTYILHVLALLQHKDISARRISTCHHPPPHILLDISLFRFDYNYRDSQGQFCSPPVVKTEPGQY